MVIIDTCLLLTKPQVRSQGIKNRYIKVTLGDYIAPIIINENSLLSDK